MREFCLSRLHLSTGLAGSIWRGLPWWCFESYAKFSVHYRCGKYMITIYMAYRVSSPRSTHVIAPLELELQRGWRGMIILLGWESGDANDHGKPGWVAWPKVLTITSLTVLLFKVLLFKVPVCFTCCFICVIGKQRWTSLTSWEWFLDSCLETRPDLTFIQITQALGYVSMLKCNLNHYHSELPSSGLSEKPMGLYWASLVLSGVGPRSEQVETLSSGPLWLSGA